MRQMLHEIIIWFPLILKWIAFVWLHLSVSIWQCDLKALISKSRLVLSKITFIHKILSAKILSAISKIEQCLYCLFQLRIAGLWTVLLLENFGHMLGNTIQEGDQISFWSDQNKVFRCEHSFLSTINDESSKAFYSQRASRMNTRRRKVLIFRWMVREWIWLTCLRHEIER